MRFSFDIPGDLTPGKKITCGVVASGNLEVIVEKNDTQQTQFLVQTAVENFQSLWALVIEEFVREYNPVGLLFSINDNGATPPVVGLRLRQALEMYLGYQTAVDNYLELTARERIRALVDENSFSEWLVEEKLYSPHLKILDLPGEADDGVIIGSATLNKQSIFVAAQQKDFMGGGVGEIHGAKLTGLFKAAAKQKVAAVVLLIDSGGVRLHEANAGEIAISELIRAIFDARQQGVMTIGVVCGKNGAYGGMGIVSACLDYVIINEIGRIGVSGAEVIEAVKGLEAFDSQDRALIWRVYGGKTKYLQKIAQCYVGNKISEIKSAIAHALPQKSPLNIKTLKKKHALLAKRLEITSGCNEEGEFLAKTHPKLAASLFDMSDVEFLNAAKSYDEANGSKQ